MDLLNTVRKEGSRGGRANFTWDDVKNDTQRENYLGHSLMAPVGRWQKGKDLQWYSRDKGEGNEQSEAQKRKEEIRKVKQQEEDAMARALGYDVPARKEDGDASGANAAPVGNERDIQRALKEGAAEQGDGEDGINKGLGYGGGGGKSFDNEERMEGTGVDRLGRRPDRRRDRSRSGERSQRQHHKGRDHRPGDRRRDRDGEAEQRHDGHMTREQVRDRSRERARRHAQTRRDEHRRRRSRSRSSLPERNHRRYRSRSRSRDRHHDRRRPAPTSYHDDYHQRRRDRDDDRRSHRSRSGSPRNRKRSRSPRHRR